MLTKFAWKYPNVQLTIILVQIMFVLASLIYAGEFKGSQNLIQDKRKVGQPNPSNLKTQWGKIRAYVGVYPKFRVRHHMMIFSLVIPLCILTDPIVYIFVILNCPHFSPSILRQFLSLRIYAQWSISQTCYTRFSFSRLLLQLISF